MLEWTARGTGSHWGLILNKGTQVLRQSFPVHITQQEDPVNQRRGLGSGWGWCSSPPQREALVPVQPVESRSADRGPSAGGRCYCVWELYTTEESLPLTNVSSRAPCTALSIHNISDNAAEPITCTWCRMCVISMHPCGINSKWVSAHARLQFVFHAALCVFSIFMSGCCGSTGSIRSMSSDSTCLHR